MTWQIIREGLGKGSSGALGINPGKCAGGRGAGNRSM